MRTIRFARHHHPKDERAPNRFWCQIGVSPLKPIMVRLLSASPVESVYERQCDGQVPLLGSATLAAGSSGSEPSRAWASRLST